MATASLPKVQRQPYQPLNTVPNELLTLEILEKETGLSSWEIERLIQDLERISRSLVKYSLPQIPPQRSEDEISNNPLLRLRVAAASILYRRNTKVDRHSKSNFKKNSYMDAGIMKLRDETVQKWSTVFDSNATTLAMIRNEDPAGSIESSPEIMQQADEVEEQKEEDESLTAENAENSKNSIFDNCYVCKQPISKKHHFYSKLCYKCADLNFKQRSETANLEGKIALVTGGRIKIGYETVLKLLRAGAMVITTTRFPADATIRYSHETDFDIWKDRLHIYPLDLRFLKDTQMFCDHLIRTYNKLDILIENAAQTIRRPVAFYKHLLQQESDPDTKYSSLIHSWDKRSQIQEDQNGFSTVNGQLNKVSLLKIQGTGMIPRSTLSSQLMVHPDDLKSCQDVDEYFPSDCYDEDHQQLDLRPVNTWTLEADQVDTAELVEVHLVNYVSPFVILNKLTPLLKKSTIDGGFGWIVLVSAMEGKFNRLKATQHPHTNCAKAALNMLVHTTAPYYRKYGLLLNSVDTGWVTDEDPISIKASREHQFHTPIDCIDGAARILHPVFQTINNNVADYGIYFKDYFSTTW